MHPKQSTSTGDRGPSILAVDDLPQNLHLLTRVLRQRGMRVRPVTSGPVALQVALAEPPDLILLDIDMPEMNGFEVCARFKAHERLREIPIIFLTAHTDAQAKVQAFALGGVDYITKPFQLEEVHARVTTHLELRRRRQEIEDAYRRLRELERARDELVHMMAHDMRSPLSALIMNLEALQEDLLEIVEAENLEDIEAAIAAGYRLSRMTDELVELNRLEQGRMPVEYADCDLVELVQRAVRNVLPSGSCRTVSVVADGPVPQGVDVKLIGRVVENLVSNGLKHTPDGLELVVTVAVDEVGEALVEVEDRGPGIPAELHDHIFDKYATLKSSTRSPGSSTGLGLAFCKQAVKAHGGRIGVHSVPGEGSRFWFSIPPGRA